MLARRCQLEGLLDPTESDQKLLNLQVILARTILLKLDDDALVESAERIQAEDERRRQPTAKETAEKEKEERKKAEVAAEGRRILTEMRRKL